MPWLLLLLVACPKGRNDAASRLAAWLRSADVAWADRGKRGLDEASKPLLSAWREFPTHPEVQWRLVRLKVAEGLASPDDKEALRFHADGRSMGLTCLDGDPVFAQLRLQGSWEEALAKLEPAREPCVAWTALAWTRWMVLQGGEASTLDLDRVDPLVSHAEGSSDAALRGLGQWSRGILSAVRPFWSGGDLPAARIQLEAAIASDPDAVVRRVDLVLLAVAPQAPQEAVTLRDAVLARPASTPEDVRARERLQAWVP